MSFKLSLPYPISANRYKATRSIPARGGKPGFTMYYLTAEAKAYKEAVGWSAKSAGIRTPLAGLVELHLQLYPKMPKKAKNPDTVRCIDLDNCLKVTLDALNGIAYEDDAQVRKITAERMQPRGDGVLVVTVSEMAAAVAELF